jgi:virginiamycin A acetyltransferase
MVTRKFFRDTIVLLAVIITLPLWIPARLSKLRKRNGSFFVTCSQLLSFIPGTLGIFLRRGFYSMTLDYFSTDCSIGFATWFSHSQMRISRCVYIGARCTLGMCEIGEDTLIGSNVDILSGRHQHQVADISKPRWSHDGVFTPVSLGRNVWIGNSAVILADVGEGSIIGAGSVVVKPIPAKVMAAGNPAVVKKNLSAPS